MLNKYRVDVSDSNIVPCGMNSIRYIGNNLKEANRVYNATKVGFTAWNKPNPDYGVILSEWNGTDYVPLLMKHNPRVL